MSDINENKLIKFEGGFYRYDPHILGLYFEKIHLEKVQSSNKIKRLEQELKDLLDEKFIEYKYPVGINEKVLVNLEMMCHTLQDNGRSWEVANH